MTTWKWTAVATVSVALVAVSLARAVTTDVFRVKATVQGGVEYIVVTNAVSKVTTNGTTIYVTNEVMTAEILSVVMDSADIINLAMGRDLGTKPPKNEVLAVTSRCGDGVLRWVVYDKEQTNILQTIGEFTPQLRAAGLKKKKESLEDISILTIFPTGSATNAFLAGSLSADAQSEVDTNGCLRTTTVTMIGWWNTLIASNHNQSIPYPVSPQPVLIRKATLKTQDSKPIGSLVIVEQ
jgi:hypothetical protein